MATTIAQADLTASQAAKLLDRIKTSVGNLRVMLLELRDRRGWAALGFATWDDCCLTEFGYTRRYANYLIEAEKVSQRTGTNVPEAHARELRDVPEDEQREVYEAAKKKHGENLTAKQLRHEVENYQDGCEDVEIDEDEEPDIVEVAEEDIEDEDDDDAIDVAPQRPLFGMALRRALNNCPIAISLNDKTLIAALEVCCCVLKTLQQYDVTLEIATCQLSAFQADLADGQFDREAR